MGSLIKSPGGTIVSGGGYIAGREALVAAAAARLTAPGVGVDAGCVSGETLRIMAQGKLPCTLHAKHVYAVEWGFAGVYIAGQVALVAATTARLITLGVGVDAGCVAGDNLRITT